MPTLNGVEVVGEQALHLFRICDELDLENVELRGFIDRLSAENQTLRSSNQGLQDQLAQAGAACRGFQHQAQDAESRLSQRPAREEFRVIRDNNGNVSSLVKESH
jgi:hypothetical protein